MCEVCDIVVNTRAYDPTRTTALRNAFIREMKRRFAELKNAIRKALIERDVFGLMAMELNIPQKNAFDFARSTDKVQAFMLWLERQEDLGILEIGDIMQIGTASEGSWTDKFITDSYKRGVMRSRYEMGSTVPSLASSGGISAVMTTPIHIDRLGLIYSRVFSELKGITNAMDNQISNILTQGIADGDNPRLLARKMISVIDGKDAGTLGTTDKLGRFIPAERRAEIMARTEIIRAHHLATIQEYRNWGLAGVKVKAEWRTAGDSRVCAECMELENHVFTLDEIEWKIPLHPQCRCIALPVIQK